MTEMWLYAFKMSLYLDLVLSNHDLRKEFKELIINSLQLADDYEKGDIGQRYLKRNPTNLSGRGGKISGIGTVTESVVDKNRAIKNKDSLHLVLTKTFKRIPKNIG